MTVQWIRKVYTQVYGKRWKEQLVKFHWKVIK